MAAKFVLAFCAQALLASVAYSQVLAAGPLGLGGAWNGLGAAGWNGLGAAGWNGLGAGCGCGGVASTGGGLPVASASPCAPVGVSVLSENVYEGRLCAGGNLPFLGSVGIEGVLPTAGAGAVSYGCGNGAVGIVSEGPIATGIASPATFAPAGPGAYAPGYGLAGIAGIDGYGLGYGYGIGGCGCGARI